MVGFLFGHFGNGCSGSGEEDLGIWSLWRKGWCRRSMVRISRLGIESSDLGMGIFGEYGYM